jgi:hypothetical protein
MTETAQDFLNDMLETSRQIRTELELLAGLSADRVAKEHSWRQAHNSAYLASSGSIPERTANAEMRTSELKRAYDEARAAEQACKERLHSWRSIISALQTAATAYREEARFARVGPQP